MYKRQVSGGGAPGVQKKRQPARLACVCSRWPCRLFGGLGLLLAQLLAQLVRRNLGIVLVEFELDQRLDVRVHDGAQGAQELGRSRQHELVEAALLVGFQQVAREVPRKLIGFLLGLRMGRLVLLVRRTGAAVMGSAAALRATDVVAAACLLYTSPSPRD